MGLSGTKSYRKLGEDPNNTKWCRDTTTFGQKIMRAHGWQPGQFLGAQDAAHAELHTRASAAPIKVQVKDDFLGLGAKARQKQSDECTGLDVFKDLLGRLNGKSENAIAKEQQVRAQIKTNLYAERRFGPMRFVKGGLLVGDKINQLISTSIAKPANTPAESSDSQDYAGESKRQKKSKKRRAEEMEDDEEIENENDKKKKKKKKKKKAKKQTKEKGSKEPAASNEKDIPGNATEGLVRERNKEKADKSLSESGDESSDKKRRKKDKKREKKRADKTRQRGTRPEDQEESEKKKEKKKKRRKQDEALAAAAQSGTEPDIIKHTFTETDTLVLTKTDTPAPSTLSNRFMVRSRNIASKRLAIADAQALNQIFMVKAA